jgi:hypothetical protein
LSDALDLLDRTPSRPASERQWDFLNTLRITAGKPAVSKPIGFENKSNRLGKFFRKYMLMKNY